MRVILSTPAGKTIRYGNGKTPGSGSFPMKQFGHQYLQRVRDTVINKWRANAAASSRRILALHLGNGSRNRFRPSAGASELEMMDISTIETRNRQVEDILIEISRPPVPLCLIRFHGGT